MRVLSSLFSLMVLAAASPVDSETIVEGYTSHNVRSPEAVLAGKAQTEALKAAVAHTQGMEFSLTQSSGTTRFRTTSGGALSGATVVDQGPLGNGLYRVRMRIPEAALRESHERRDGLESTRGSGSAESRDLGMARQKAVHSAIEDAVSRAAAAWYGDAIPEEIAGRYYLVGIRDERVAEADGPFSYQAKVEVKVAFPDPRLTAVPRSTWGRIKGLPGAVGGWLGRCLSTLRGS